MINSKIQNLMVRRANEDESGFTLIELLIVMIIIGVLAAIAIPAFLNQQKGARDTQTTSDVRNAAIAVQTLVTRYPDADTFSLHTAETAGTAITGATNGTTQTTVFVGANGTTAREKITLSPGTRLTVSGTAGSDAFTITGYNAKGKNYDGTGTPAKVRTYKSDEGGLK